MAALASALVLTLTGCASTSEWAAPQVAVPATWQQAPAASPADAPQTATATLTANPSWWTTLGDPALSGLIEQALQRNGDMVQAAMRVQRARLVADQAGSDRLPSVSANVSTSASRALSSGGSTSRAYGANASVSWEADLWGRLAAAQSAAEWEAQATQADRDGAALSLSVTVAQLYWQLAYLNQRVEASEQSIAYARETLRLVRAQYEAGAVSGLEIAQATQSLAAQEAAHTQWLQQRVEARNALSILFDGPPGALMQDDDRRLSQADLPPVSAGLPASLLTRRPDLQASELRLRKTLATVDATRRSYYPTLTLTGSVGSSSSALSEVLRNPVGTLGAGLLLPFIQWRDMERNVAISQTDHELAVVAYRQAWYQALSDVEDALSAQQQYEAQGVQLTTAAQAARQAERLNEARYRAGAVPLKSWLDAQESRRQAENNLAQNQLNRLLNRATLVQALGGTI